MYLKTGLQGHFLTSIKAMHSTAPRCISPARKIVMRTPDKLYKIWCNTLVRRCNATTCLQILPISLHQGDHDQAHNLLMVLTGPFVQSK